MENTITTDFMISIGFENKPKTFRKENIVLKKHPTMNWLIYDSEYLKTISELKEFLTKHKYN